MNKKVKILLLIVVLGTAGFFGARYYAYHAGQRDIQSEDAAYTVASTAVVNEFTSDVNGANKKYLGKPVAISGTITSVNAKEVILDNSVNCNLNAADSNLKNGQKVTIKGRVVGFDDLLGELKLDQCNISNTK